MQEQQAKEKEIVDKLMSKMNKIKEAQKGVGEDNVKIRTHKQGNLSIPRCKHMLYHTVYHTTPFIILYRTIVPHTHCIFVYANKSFDVPRQLKIVLRSTNRNTYQNHII